MALFIPYIHPDDVALATSVDGEHVAGLMARKESYRNEFRIVRPDGSIRWVQSTACVVVDGPTGHRRAIGCVTDISEERLNAPPPSRRSVAMEAMPASGAASGKSEGPAPCHLTDQERACLTWASLGKTAWETATILGVSRRTVEFHLANATRKLGATNKLHAAFIAVRDDLLGDLSHLGASRGGSPP